MRAAALGYERPIAAHGRPPASHDCATLRVRGLGRPVGCGVNRSPVAHDGGDPRDAVAASTLLIPSGLRGNLYVTLLGRAYQRAGIHVVYGPDNLSESSYPFEAIHLQWPEEQYRGPGSGGVEERVKRFLEKLDAHKQRGTRLVWTVHNISPHEHRNSEIDKKAYQGVIDRADLIVHHCARSATLLSEAYLRTQAVPSIVVPHGHYVGAYADEVTKLQARQKLRIPHDATVFLSFGLIRGYKGIDLFRRAYSRARIKEKFLLVAGHYTGVGGVKGKLESLRLALATRFDSRSRFDLKAVDDDDVQLYFRAADAVVLSHSAGLNSGVAVLGMTFGKLVIGPDLGCMGQVLMQGDNLVYEANNEGQLITAMEKVSQKNLDKVALANTRAALSWDWGNIVDQVLSTLPLPMSATQAA
jgi:beta-1,4-mannosyltransferase